jgi:hypothetical protein
MHKMLFVRGRKLNAGVLVVIVAGAAATIPLYHLPLVSVINTVAFTSHPY